MGKEKEKEEESPKGSKTPKGEGNGETNTDSHKTDLHIKSLVASISQHPAVFSFDARYTNF